MKIETEIEMVTEPGALASVVSDLKQESVIACDLEADSLHHYQEKICLIQLACPQRSILIDPLAFSDISHLAPLFADPAICKVFHGADYDIRSLYRDYAMEVVNLFDTMIACQLLGEKEVGLAAVVKKRFGVELDKRYQKADWSRRPLPEEMKEYAAEDTTLLIDLYGQLRKELKEKGRLSWVEEECALLARVRSGCRSAEPFFLRFKGAARMEPRTLAVLEELLRARDDRARAADLPPFKILGNDFLRQVAEKTPRKPADLVAIPGFPAKLIERHGRWIVAAVARGMAVPADKLPRFPRVKHQEKERWRDELLKKLKNWREGKAASIGIDAGVLVNNSVLEALVDKAYQVTDTLPQVEGMKQWQRVEFEKELVKLLQGVKLPHPISPQ